MCTSLHQVMFFMEQPPFLDLEREAEGRCVPDMPLRE